MIQIYSTYHIGSFFFFFNTSEDEYKMMLKAKKFNKMERRQISVTRKYLKRCERIYQWETK